MRGGESIRGRRRAQGDQAGQSGQGLEIAEPLARAGLRVIAVSRFGYLRTPLPADASAAAQADAHACVLDALGIRRAAVLGVSAGGPSALQFALRHPERTAALVLLVPAVYAPRPNDAPPVHTPRGNPAPAGADQRRRGRGIAAALRA